VTSSDCELSSLGPLVLLLPTTFNLAYTNILALSVYLMKIIPETRRTH